MPRKERKHRETGIYHVMLRGWANQRPVPLISLAKYFKDIYEVDSLHYMYTEMPISEFPTYHFRKNNMYCRLSWIPEETSELSNTIALEYINGPVYRMAEEITE